MTPRQVLRHLAAAMRRHERDEQSRRWHTWHVAALPNMKRFPAFDEFVRPRRAEPTVPRRQRQSTDEQIAAMQAIMKGRRR